MVRFYFSVDGGCLPGCTNLSTISVIHHQPLGKRTVCILASIFETGGSISPPCALYREEDERNDPNEYDLIEENLNYTERERTNRRIGSIAIFFVVIIVQGFITYGIHYAFGDDESDLAALVSTMLVARIWWMNALAVYLFLPGTRSFGIVNEDTLEISVKVHDSIR